MYSRYNGYQYENQEKLKRYCFIKCLYTSLHIQVHLAGALQKSDILKYMWIYINDLSRRMRSFSRWKVISCE